MWYEERVDISKQYRHPTFSLCCREGRVHLHTPRSTPVFLDGLLDYQVRGHAASFRENIRLYNSLLQFTSIGAKVDHSINRRAGPFIFKISGQNYHRIGSLVPLAGKKPQFAQLYIYDTENELQNRKEALNCEDKTSIDDKLLQDLLDMLDDNNEVVKAFRMVRNRLNSSDVSGIKFRLLANRTNTDRVYIAPIANEIVGLIVGDFDQLSNQRDVIIEHRSEGFQRINSSHPLYMAMQYPLLFPFGEDGYRTDINYRTSGGRRQVRRNCMTMREYFAYMIQQPLNHRITLLRGGRLFHQFLVDAFATVEGDRL